MNMGMSTFTNTKKSNVIPAPGALWAAESSARGVLPIEK